MSHTPFSYSGAAPPRPGFERPLALETTHEEVPAGLLVELDQIAQSAQRLPRPFQQVVEIRRTPVRLVVTLERFCGLDGKQLANALRVVHRVLPLNVWLALADRWLAAVEQITPDNSRAWATSWRHAQIGVDLTGELALTFDQFNHVLGHWPSPQADLGSRGRSGETMAFNIAPEVVRRQPVVEASRVHSLAASLVFLLTGQHPFAAIDAHQRLKNLVEGIPSWHPDRHPQCTPELSAVLGRALEADPARRWQSIAEFRAALGEAARVRPASEEVVAGAVFAVMDQLMRWRFAELHRERDLLPASWANGGLGVMEDRLLELAMPLSEFPKVNAPPVTHSPGRPRINLATVGQPARWWQRFWARS